MPNLYVQNIPPGLHARLEDLAAATEGGKRAIILDALGAYLSAGRPDGAWPSAGLVAAYRQVQKLLPDPSLASTEDTARALRLIADAACPGGLASEDMFLRAVATARDARRLAARIIPEEPPTLPDLEPALGREVTTWARTWLVTAIATCVQEHLFDWDSVARAADRSGDLDADLETGRFSKMRRDWRLATWREIPEVYRKFIHGVIHDSLSRFTVIS